MQNDIIQQAAPILEFDAAPEAVLEPRRLITAIDLPENAVVCFFQEVITTLVQEQQECILKLKSEPETFGS